jgi:hypothetical protein
MGGSVMIWAAISWYSVGPFITLHGRIIAREYMDRLGNQVHPMIQTFFQTIMPLFPQLEPFIHGLKNTKMNFNIFPGQHNSKIRASLNQARQFWRLE